MKPRPPAPVVPQLVADISARVDAMYAANDRGPITVSAAEMHAYDEWAVAWSNWYGHGGRKTSRMKDGRRERRPHKGGEWAVVGQKWMWGRQVILDDR